MYHYLEGFSWFFNAWEQTLCQISIIVERSSFNDFITVMNAQQIFTGTKKSLKSSTLQKFQVLGSQVTDLTVKNHTAKLFSYLFYSWFNEYIKAELVFLRKHGNFQCLTSKDKFLLFTLLKKKFLIAIILLFITYFLLI